MKFPGVVAVLCVVPSGLVLHVGIISCTFPPWTEMSKKNGYVYVYAYVYLCLKLVNTYRIFLKLVWLDAKFILLCIDTTTRMNKQLLAEKSSFLKEFSS